MSRVKHCDTCTCGLTHIEWSDREGTVDLSDANDIASTVIGCALDHSYDRTTDGIPDGFPDDLRSKLAPIVRRHLSAINENWEHDTIYMSDKQRKAFKQELIRASRPAGEE